MCYKRIMVSVDGSETSDLALLEAINLSSALQAKLCIIHIANEFPDFDLLFGSDLTRFQQSIRQEGQAILNSMQEIAVKKGLSPDIQLIEINNAIDKVSEKIVASAKSWCADLLVVGTHGRRGFRRILLGSVAEETIRITPIPVLLVRANEHCK